MKKTQITFSLLIVLLFSVASCRKVPRKTYRLSGIYNLTKIEQTIIADGVSSTETFEEPGFLYLRYEGFNGTTLNPGVLNVNDETNEALQCLDEIGGSTIFDWAIVDEDLVWERSYNEAGWPVFDSCFFSIDQDKKFKKVISYESDRVLPDGSTYNVQEVFYMKLKKD